jgi:hypothetical protein
VIEGLSNSGKTSLLRAIKREQAKDDNSERSVVILGEHYSQALQGIDNEPVMLTQEEHQKLLADRVRGIEELNDWAIRLGGSASRRSRGLFLVFERFHINHRYAYDYDEAFIGDLESRLGELGATCLLLTVSPEHIVERLTFRVRASGQVVDARELREEADRWLSEQDTMVREASKSSLPTTLLNTDAMEWDSYAAQILASAGPSL